MVHLASSSINSSLESVASSVHHPRNYILVFTEIQLAMGCKGVNSVLMCVLLLGLVLEQAQVEGKSCCRSTTARNCYNTCRFAGTSQKTCANLCDCIHISGSKCPANYPKLNFLPRFEESDRVEYCSIGCRSLMCDSMDSDGAEDVKINVKRCGYACDRFCNGDASNTPVVA
ncbi:unnamed protein product [Urochloa decumbens]|uniref:Acidic protein n=1 Tax=Urochloa decumbens TaxID=240449 RepID=A0ABC9EZ19_9POAL